MNSESTRLNKYLALSLGISRREADEYIQRGRVQLNGKPAELGNSVLPDSKILVDNKPLTLKMAHEYFVLHKPVGYVCSRKAQGDNPTIYNLLPTSMAHLKPVGRLDKDSSGILLLTNDGDFAHRMTHPKFQKTKVYIAELDIPLQPLHQQMISDYGVEIGDGTSKLQLERLDDVRQKWQVTMHEGRNRQIRRTFAALGYNVNALHRTSFGPFTLKSLQPGEYTSVTT